MPFPLTNGVAETGMVTRLVFPSTLRFFSNFGVFQCDGHCHAGVCMSLCIHD
jgi:hypothetical protein